MTRRPQRKKLKILVTAGSTREPIDPVRFISNRSTGKMGAAIADEASKRGHETILIHGPAEYLPSNGVKKILAETARDMRRGIEKHFGWCDALVMAAAVSDYRPAKPRKKKIKKDGKLSLQLVENPDILKELGKRKDGKILVGFALETENLLENAAKKLKKKNLDFIVGNKVSNGSLPFGEGINDYVIVDKELKESRHRSVTKEKLARLLLDKIQACITREHQSGDKILR